MHLFGEIELSLEYLTPTQLEEALALQREEDRLGLPHRRIGEICRAMGFLDEEREEVVWEYQLGDGLESPSGQTHFAY